MQDAVNLIKSNMKKLQIPFIGSKQQTWVYPCDIKSGRVTLVDNYEFETTLRYMGFSRGRSSLNIEWLDLKTNQTYQSGMYMLDDFLKGSLSHECVINPTSLIFQVTGKFTFKKQGTSILLKSV